MNKIFAAALALSLCAPSFMANAEEKQDGPPRWFHLVGDEYFPIPVQDGWQVVWADPKSGESLIEIDFMPVDQDPADWQDKLTIQVIPKEEDMTAELMINQIAVGFKKLCLDHIQTPNFPGMEKGIQSFQAIVGCEWQPPEFDKTVFENLYLRVFESPKAIYVQQRAWRLKEFSVLMLPPEIYEEDLGPINNFVLCSLSGEGIPVCPIGTNDQ